MKKAKMVLALVLMVCMVCFSAIACSAPEQTSKDDPAVVEGNQDVVTGDDPTDEPEEFIIAHVPKSIGGAWYTRMFAGFERFAADKDHVTVVQIGASQGDASLQNAAIEDFITEVQGKKAAICISFVSPEASEQVLQKAMEAGIIVIGDEGPDNVNLNYNLEAFINQEYAENVADKLAAMMGEEGKYAIFVGRLTSQLHVLWSDIVRETIESKYPNIELVTYPYLEGNYDQQGAYETTMELFRIHPDLKGIWGCSATCSAGVARAIEETNRMDSVSFMSNGTPDLYVEFIKSGAVDIITGWDPSMMGEAMCVVAYKVLNGEPISAGDDLGVFGFDSIYLNGKLITGNRWQHIDTSNVDEILARDY